MEIRDRIQSLVRIKASDLVPNERNWREHPEAQQSALSGILSEIGYVDAIIVRPVGKGRYEIIDGHLRATTTPDMEVPCLVVDLTDDEAKKVLATFDSVSSLARTNVDILSSLRNEITFESADVASMLDGIIEQSKFLQGGWGGQAQTSAEEIAEYDPANETSSIRVNKVLAADKEKVAALVAKTIEDADLAYKVEVF